MKKLLVSFKTLGTLANQAKGALNATEKIREESDEFRSLIQLDGHFAPLRSDWFVNHIIRNQILLIACSALDEFNKCFTAQACPEFADRINQLRRQIRPVTRRIDQWKDLRKYRNQMIAHNLRIEGHAIIDREGNSLSYSIPYLHGEYVLLVNLLALLINQIAKAFPELAEQMRSTETIRDKMTINLVPIDWEVEYQAVIDELERQASDQRGAA
jgi:hypothetical protein